MILSLRSLANLSRPLREGIETTDGLLPISYRLQNRLLASYQVARGEFLAAERALIERAMVNKDGDFTHVMAKRWGKISEGVGESCPVAR